MIPCCQLSALQRLLRKFIHVVRQTRPYTCVPYGPLLLINK